MGDLTAVPSLHSGFDNPKKQTQLLLQCPPLNRITLGQHKSDNNNQMIQLTDVLRVLLRYKWASSF